MLERALEEKTWIWTLALLYSSYLTLSNRLYLSEPPFPFP